MTKAHPYTIGDLAMGEQIVRELHGLKGYEAWAEHIAKAIAAERMRCSEIADRHREGLVNGGAINACKWIASAIRGSEPAPT